MMNDVYSGGIWGPQQLFFDMERQAAGGRQPGRLPYKWKGDGPDGRTTVSELRHSTPVPKGRGSRQVLNWQNKANFSGVGCLWSSLMGRWLGRQFFRKSIGFVCQKQSQNWVRLALSTMIGACIRTHLWREAGALT